MLVCKSEGREAGLQHKERLPLLNSADPPRSCQVPLPLSLTQASCSPSCLVCAETQVRVVSVCTEQLSGFLWSCHARLAQATAAEPRLTPAAPPERWSSANVIGLLMHCFHCCAVCRAGVRAVVMSRDFKVIQMLKRHV